MKASAGLPTQFFVYALLSPASAVALLALCSPLPAAGAFGCSAAFECWLAAFSAAVAMPSVFLAMLRLRSFHQVEAFALML